MSLSKEERDRQYNDAKAFIDLMNDRLEEERAKGVGATWQAIEKALKGIQRVPFDVIRASNVSPKAMWALSVACVLKDLGHEADYILRFRLGRRQKSHDQSWPVIIRGLHKLGMFVTEHEAKQILKNSIPMFLHALDSNGITRDYRETIAA